MEAQDEKHKRKVHRSPSYPAFDLTEAITKATTVYEKEKRSATTAEVLAGHMGYSAAVGPGGRAVSALRQYGLIEEVNGKYRLSDLGYTLVHYDHSSFEWRAAIVDAIKGPTLFRELLLEYPEGLPSDATLRNDLLKREFNPSSIPDVVSIFRATMSLVDFENPIHNGAGDVAMQNDTTKPESQTSAASVLAKKAAEAFMAAKTRTYSFALSPDAKAELNITGDVGSEDLETLRDYIDITIKALGRKSVN